MKCKNGEVYPVAKKPKVDYDYDVDLFAPPTWPQAFLKDPAYALFRPLYEYTSPWRSSQAMLSLYLHSQSRRLGGHRYLLFYFSNLAKISESYPSLNWFLRSPFYASHDLNDVFSELEIFLRWRFTDFKDDPWRDYPFEEQYTDKERKIILKKNLSKIPKVRNFRDMEEYKLRFIENALKECPNLTINPKYNSDLVHHIFSSPIPELTLQLGRDGYVISEIPVILGSHFLDKKYTGWFKDNKFYRILGCYARWDDAKVIIFKDVTMLSSLKGTYKLRTIGEMRRGQIDGEDYLLSILVDSDLPEKSFVISEWELNVSQLTILI